MKRNPANHSRQGEKYGIRSAIERTMERVWHYSRRSVVALGDYNSRHKSLCTRNDERGVGLEQWCKEQGWSITAQLSPTFVNSSGVRSKIDLAVHRLLGEVDTYSPQGIWREPVTKYQCFKASEEKAHHAS